MDRLWVSRLGEMAGLQCMSCENIFPMSVKVQKIVAVTVSLTGIRSQHSGSRYRPSLSAVVPAMTPCSTIYTSITPVFCIASYTLHWFSVLPYKTLLMRHFSLRIGVAFNNPGAIREASPSFGQPTSLLLR